MALKGQIVQLPDVIIVMLKCISMTHYILGSHLDNGNDWHIITRDPTYPNLLVVSVLHFGHHIFCSRITHKGKDCSGVACEEIVVTVRDEM